MTFTKNLKKYRILSAAIIAYILVFLYNYSILTEALNTLKIYLVEMLQVLPAVFVITGIIEVWVPREKIISTFGSGSGLKGKLVSILIGSFSAGPIYAAFPVTQSLLKKGASVMNMVLILSAWAVVKVPMLLVETKFLGFDFMITRYLLTIPGILLIGYGTQRLVSSRRIRSAIDDYGSKLRDEIKGELPDHNCGVCGYGGCADYAEAIVNEDADLDRCSPGGEEVERKISKILQKQG